MKKAKKKSVSLFLIQALFSLTSLALSISVIVATNVNRSAYNEMESLTDGYLRCTNDVLQLDEVSDFLTSRAMEYVATGSKTAAERYVTETNESKNREKALAHFQTYFANTDVYRDLTSALSYSNQLSEQEFYAMRLASDFYGFDKAPSAIQSITLTAEDSLLAPEAKKDKATTMIFGESYQLLKSKIDGSIQSCLNGLIDVTEQRKLAASESVSKTMMFHDIAAGALLALVVASGAATWFLVLDPLRKIKGAIDDNHQIKVSGSREIRFASEAYNKVFESNEHKKEVLQFEVSHDILTGIPNRHDYVDTCNRLAKDEVIFIIADVDHFKSINDTCGHAMGDSVLSEVARRLRETFLNHDRVFRIGGDEFVVMVFDTDHKRRGELKKICEGLNTAFETLHKKQNFPLVSLSFGVTLKKAEETFESAYREADKVLYKVKENGGCGVMFDPNFFEEK